MISKFSCRSAFRSPLLNCTSGANQRLFRTAGADEIALVWLNHDGFFVVYLKEDKVQRKHAGEEPPLTLRLKLLFYELTHGRKQRGVAFP